MSNSQLNVLACFKVREITPRIPWIPTSWLLIGCWSTGSPSDWSPWSPHSSLGHRPWAPLVWSCQMQNIEMKIPHERDSSLDTSRHGRDSSFVLSPHWCCFLLEAGSRLLWEAGQGSPPPPQMRPIVSDSLYLTGLSMIDWGPGVQASGFIIAAQSQALPGTGRKIRARVRGGQWFLKHAVTWTFAINIF